jgi:hypothetical protein
MTSFGLGLLVGGMSGALLATLILAACVLAARSDRQLDEWTRRQREL